MTEKLESEAVLYMKQKRQHFLDELDEYTAKLEKHMRRNLWDSDELQAALKAVSEARLWARYCSEKYNLK
jgi:hypothetical protein